MDETKFPNSERWVDVSISRPMSIGEAYRNQLIAIELNNGRVKIYNGENGMEPTTDWTKEQTLSWDIDHDLTNILKARFSHIKVVRVADL